MNSIIKNPFERKQKGAVVILCVLMLAGSLSSCSNKNENDIDMDKVSVFNTLVPCQMENDTLIILDACCDGYRYYYTKISNSLTTSY